MTYVTYEYNKDRIKQWRLDNPDEYLALARRHSKAYFERKIYGDFERECKKFRRILL
jgi:hypothetical protein